MFYVSVGQQVFSFINLCKLPDK